MKLLVPTPALGLRVVLPDENNKSHTYEIAEVDFIKRTYSARPFGENATKPWRLNIPMDSQYHPASDRINFERALSEWDYFYSTHDDHRRYEEGLDSEKELVRMFRSLSIEDQLHYRKIVAIATYCE